MAGEDNNKVKDAQLVGVVVLPSEVAATGIEVMLVGTTVILTDMQHSSMMTSGCFMPKTSVSI